MDNSNRTKKRLFYYLLFIIWSDYNTCHRSSLRVGNKPLNVLPSWVHVLHHCWHKRYCKLSLNIIILCFIWRNIIQNVKNLLLDGSQKKKLKQTNISTHPVLFCIWPLVTHKVGFFNRSISYFSGHIHGHFELFSEFPADQRIIALWIIEYQTQGTIACSYSHQQNESAWF